MKKKLLITALIALAGASIASAVLRCRRKEK
jgi:hypothetical protein